MNQKLEHNVVVVRLLGCGAFKRGTLVGWVDARFCRWLDPLPLAPPSLAFFRSRDRHARISIDLQSIRAKTLAAWAERSQKSVDARPMRAPQFLRSSSEGAGRHERDIKQRIGWVSRRPDPSSDRRSCHIKYPSISDSDLSIGHPTHGRQGRALPEEGAPAAGRGGERLGPSIINTHTHARHRGRAGQRSGQRKNGGRRGVDGDGRGRGGNVSRAGGGQGEPDICGRARPTSE